MRPEFNSRRLYGITRSKGKMYEFGIPEQSHIAIPSRDEPKSLFFSTVATLGDAAAALNDSPALDDETSTSTFEDLDFAASFFDAFVQSRFAEAIASDVTLLASATYYMARRPGSSLVLAKRMDPSRLKSQPERLLHWLLNAVWSNYPTLTDPVFKEDLTALGRLIAFHFHNGSGLEQLPTLGARLRDIAYSSGTSGDLLLIDISLAVARMRVLHSTWTTLPLYSRIPINTWAPFIQRTQFPKELWPSQLLLGRSGLYAGESGVVQMPTSAGKTRAVEIILRSAFLAGRARIAVVVAPFRALCHEISASLHLSFKPDAIRVNEFSDVLQDDFLDLLEDGDNSALADILKPKSILVLTPEKFLYVLRQLPTVVGDIGIVVYDEGHQFDSGSRGVTYELLLTEIKALLPGNAQTVLVSAVIKNADAVGKWLIGESARTVRGNHMLPTARSVAFASWLETLGQVMFFEGDNYANVDYFVPRVIERQELNKLSAREKLRHFPEKGDSSDTALYLGLRLSSRGSIAIFCGRKDAASKIASRAVDIYKRGYSQAPPIENSDREEAGRLKWLLDEHFGTDSILSEAASNGIFVHHGGTPQGVRLSIEYAMQREKIRFIACTSTLAQGVNLPIRYLIVSSVYQGAERIKVRDFQNLMGRAGRAGMHTEGVVIFADPDVFDKRRSRTDGWRYKTSIDMLSIDNTEDTASSLLGLLDPLELDRQAEITLSSAEMCRLLLGGQAIREQWVSQLGLSAVYSRKILNELRDRARLVSALESHLMAYRGELPFGEFKSAAEDLARKTLAFSLANELQKPALLALFGAVAEYIQSVEPEPLKQALYSRTLLGVASAKRIQGWVQENLNVLAAAVTNNEWLGAVWPLFEILSDDKVFHSVEPRDLPIQLAKMWMLGSSFKDMHSICNSAGGTKPWGARRRSLTTEDVIDFCENTLGYDCSLILAAVGQFLLSREEEDLENVDAFPLFQKCLTYGLPDQTAVSAYDYGFADRMVAQQLGEVLQQEMETAEAFESLLGVNIDRVREVLNMYPSYFASLLQSRLPN